MADKTTFIKIDRNIIEWRWFKDSKAFQVFIWLLIKANVKDHAFHKESLERGSLATSYESIADGCGMSVMSVRRIIRDLEETGEIEREIKNHYQVIRIVKYDEYQGCSKTISQTTGKQQPNEQANNNDIRIYKNIKNDKNIYPPKSPLGGLDPSGEPQRGTDGFRAKAHLLLTEDEGTVDDIPTVYRDGTYQRFDNFRDYWRFRNQ